MSKLILGRWLENLKTSTPRREGVVWVEEEEEWEEEEEEEEEKGATEDRREKGNGRGRLACCTPIRSAHKQKERREQEAEKGAGTLRPTLAGPADQGLDPCGPLLFRPGLEATWKERGWSILLDTGSIAPCRGQRHMWWKKRSEESGTAWIGKGASINTDFDPGSFRAGVPGPGGATHRPIFPGTARPGSPITGQGGFEKEREGDAPLKKEASLEKSDPWSIMQEQTSLKASSIHPLGMPGAKSRQNTVPHGDGLRFDTSPFLTWTLLPRGDGETVGGRGRQASQPLVGASFSSTSPTKG
ncbi:hypothetical protein QR685DRAFT_544275 [Neurospora intermedia]|uniref:Uncharacterized protein n=1 Tax=Neurospora intermedia TaxID=5142 RepID=A0ABR3DD55_NEUIN